MFKNLHKHEFFLLIILITSMMQSLSLTEISAVTQTSSATSMKLYENINIKNWSVDLIKTELIVDHDTYAAIHVILMHEMITLKLLRKMLNTKKNKQHLQKIFAKLTCQFSAVFDLIFQLWKQKCLTVLTQKCNNNEWQWISRSAMCSVKSLSLHSWFSTSSFSTLWKQSHSSELLSSHQIFSQMCILVWQFKTERSIVIWLLNLLISRIDQNLITVDDMKFDKFVEILREKIAYSSSKNVILYQYNENEEIEIINE